GDDGDGRECADQSSTRPLCFRATGSNRSRTKMAWIRLAWRSALLTVGADCLVASTLRPTPFGRSLNLRPKKTGPFMRPSRKKAMSSPKWRASDGLPQARTHDTVD